MFLRGSSPTRSSTIANQTNQFSSWNVPFGYAVQRAGREAFLFASDWPHEGFDAPIVRHEIDELLEGKDLADADKTAALAGNAVRIYVPK